jgi:hypothetical protein
MHSNPPSHATPHAPQWFESSSSDTHCPAQRVWPPEHAELPAEPPFETPAEPALPASSSENSNSS